MSVPPTVDNYVFISSGNHIKYKNLLFFSLINDCVQYMELVHRQKLLGIKNDYTNREPMVLNASEFQSVMSIMRRYKDKLVGSLAPHLQAPFAEAMLQGEAMEQRGSLLVLELQKVAKRGALHIVSRPDDGSRYISQASKREW